MPEEVQMPGHETSDVSGRGTAWFALGLALSVFVIAVLVWRMEEHLDPTGVAWPHQPTSAEPAHQPPAPVLQPRPLEDLKHLREAEDTTLQTYGWVDRKAGVIRIPLERAKSLLLQRGLPKTGTTMPLPGPQPNTQQSTLPAPVKGETP